MKNRGFTLVELLVSMAITAIIITVLVVCTSMVSSAYRRNSDNIEISRKANAAMEVLADDVEVMVTRPGNNFEWLYLGQGHLSSAADEDVGDSTIMSSNAQLIFLYSTVDRYNGVPTAGEGDVSLVSYRLAYRNEIASLDGANSADDEFRTFALYRHNIDPDDAFVDGYIGVEAGDGTSPLTEGLVGQYGVDNANALSASNLLVENIVSFTAVFEVEHDSGSLHLTIKPLDSAGVANATTPGSTEGTFLSLSGRGIRTDVPAFVSPTTPITNARIKSVTFNVTTVSSRGIRAMNNKALTLAELINQFGQTFTTSVRLRNAL